MKILFYKNITISLFLISSLHLLFSFPPTKRGSPTIFLTPTTPGSPPFLLTPTNRGSPTIFLTPTTPGNPPFLLTPTNRGSPSLQVQSQICE